jgi:hypothetical protein
MSLLSTFGRIVFDGNGKERMLHKRVFFFSHREHRGHRGFFYQHVGGFSKTKFHHCKRSEAIRKSLVIIGLLRAAPLQ